MPVWILIRWLQNTNQASGLIVAHQEMGTVRNIDILSSNIFKCWISQNTVWNDNIPPSVTSDKLDHHVRLWWDAMLVFDSVL